MDWSTGAAYIKTAPLVQYICLKYMREILIIRCKSGFSALKAMLALDRNLGLGYNTLILRLIPGGLLIVHIPKGSSTHFKIILDSQVALLP